MSPGDIIRHKKWKDIAFQVDSVIDTGNAWQVMGEYINLGYTNSWHLGIGVHSHVITKPSEWERMCTDKDKCLRYNKWTSVQ